MAKLSLRVLTPCVVASLSVAMAGCAAGSGESTGSSAQAVDSTNNQTAFEYFVGKGLTDIQAAGIVGNLDQESGMDPSIAQYGGGPGRGLAQWSVGGRWDTDTDDNVAWYASQQGASEWSLSLQLDFIWYELQTFHSYGLASLQAATTITEATVAFQDDFEGCGECDESQRIAFAQQAYDDYHGSGGGSGTGSGSSGSSSGGSAPAGCYSDTLGKETPANACVQSKYDDQWYQCDDGDWVDRWTDPTACDGVYPL
jgi:hypothetical protein